MEFTIELTAKEVEQVATYLQDHHGYWGDRQLDAQSMVIKKFLKEFDHADIRTCCECDVPILGDGHRVVGLDGYEDCCEDCYDNL